MTNEIFKEKLHNGTFTKKELSDLAWCDVEVDVKEVCQEEGESHRWTRNVSTIFEFENKFYCLDWQKGLTEYQENEFYNQPYEVEKVVKTIEKIKWKRVGK